MPNELVQSHRQSHPNDHRSDDEITELIEATYPGEYTGYTDFAADLQRIAQARQQEQAAERRANAPSLLEEMNLGFNRGLEGLYSTATGAAGLAARAVGADNLSRELMESAQYHSEEAAASAGTIQRFEDAETAADYVRYLAGGAAEVFPSLGEAVVTGLAGAAAGSVAGPGGTFGGMVGGVLGKSAAKQMIKKGVTKALNKELRDEIEKVATGKLVASAATELTRKQLARVAKGQMRSRAQNMAILMNSQALSSGEIYNELLQNGIDPDAAIDTAVLGGFVAAVPDTILPSMILKRMIPDVGNTVIKKEIGNVVLKHTKNIVQSIGVEASTEAFQEAVNIVALRREQGVPLDVLEYSEEEMSRLKNASALGAIGGGMGGASTFLTPNPKTKQKIKDAAMKAVGSKLKGTQSESEREALYNLANAFVSEDMAGAVTPQTAAAVASLSGEAKARFSAFSREIRDNATDDTLGEHPDEENDDLSDIPESASLDDRIARVKAVTDANPELGKQIIEMLTGNRAVGRGDGVLTDLERSSSILSAEEVAAQKIEKRAGGLEPLAPLGETARGAEILDLAYPTEEELAAEPKSKTVTGFHKSSNIDSIQDGFEQRDLGISFADTEEGVMSSPTQGDRGGRPGNVKATITGASLDYLNPAHQRRIDGIQESIAEAITEIVDTLTPMGLLEDGIVGDISELPAGAIELIRKFVNEDGSFKFRDVLLLDSLRAQGIDFVENFNGIGDAKGEIHVINASAIKVEKEPKSKRAQARAARKAEEKAQKEYDSRVEEGKSVVDDGDIVGPNRKSEVVTIIDTIDKDGAFSGSIAITGYNTKQEAVDAFTSMVEQSAQAGGNQVNGADFIGAVTEIRGGGLDALTSFRKEGRRLFNSVREATGALPFAHLGRFRGTFPEELLGREELKEMLPPEHDMIKRIQAQEVAEVFTGTTSRPAEQIDVDAGFVTSIVQKDSNGNTIKDANGNAVPVMIEETNAHWEDGPSTNQVEFGTRRDASAERKQIWFRVDDNYDGVSLEEDLVAQYSPTAEEKGNNVSAATVARVTFFETPNGQVIALGTGRRLESSGKTGERKVMVSAWPDIIGPSGDVQFEGREGWITKAGHIRKNPQGISLDKAMDLGLKPIGSIRLRRALTNKQQFDMAKQWWQTREQWETNVGRVLDDQQNSAGTIYRSAQERKVISDLGYSQSGLAKIAKQSGFHEFTGAAGTATSEPTQMNMAFAINIREVAPMVKGEIKEGIKYDDWVDIMVDFSNDPDNEEVIDWLTVEAAQNLLEAWPRESEGFTPKELRGFVSQLVNLRTFEAYEQGKFRSDYTLAPGAVATAAGPIDLFESEARVTQAFFDLSRNRGQGEELAASFERRRKTLGIPNQGVVNFADIDIDTARDSRGELLTPEAKKKQRSQQEAQRLEAKTKAEISEKASPRPGLSKKVRQSNPEVIKRKKSGVEVVVTSPDVVNWKLDPEVAPVENAFTLSTPSTSPPIGQAFPSGYTPPAVPADSAKIAADRKAREEEAAKARKDGSVVDPVDEHNRTLRSMVDLETGQPLAPTPGQIAKERTRLLNAKQAALKDPLNKQKRDAYLVQLGIIEDAEAYEVDKESRLEAERRAAIQKERYNEEGNVEGVAFLGLQPGEVPPQFDVESDERQRLKYLQEGDEEGASLKRVPDFTLSELTQQQSTREKGKPRQFRGHKISGSEAESFSTDRPDAPLRKQKYGRPSKQGPNRWGGMHSRPESLPDLNPSMREAFKRLRGILMDIGVDVELLDLHADQETAKMLGFYIDEDGNPVDNAVFNSAKMTMVLGMTDVANPSLENFRQLLHETAHLLFVGESKSVQEQILAAISKMTDESLGISGSRDPGIVGDNKITLDTLLQEERLAEFLSFFGIAKEPSRSIAAQIFRHVKDVLFRAAMWLQRTFLGPRHNSPRLVKHFLKNRMNLLYGKPASMIPFLGGEKLKPADMYELYPSQLGEGWVREFYDWKEGELTYDPAGSDDAVAMRHNMFSKGVRFTRGITTNQSQRRSGEDADVIARHEVAALNEVNDVLLILFDRFNLDGHNSNGMKFQEFAKMLGVPTLPIPRIKQINLELGANGLPVVRDGVMIKDLVEKDRASRFALKKLNSIYDKWATLVAKAEANIPIQQDRATKESERLAALQLKYQNADVLQSELLTTIHSTLKGFTRDLKNFGDKSWTRGLLTRHLEVFEGEESDRPAEWKPVVDRVIARINENKMAFTNYLLLVARLDIDWNGSVLDAATTLTGEEMNEIAGRNTFHLLVKQGDKEAQAVISLISSFARENPAAMAWMSVREKQNAGIVSADEVSALRTLLDAIREESGSVHPEVMKLVKQLARKTKAAGVLQQAYQAHRAKTFSIFEDIERMQRVVDSKESIRGPLTEHQVRLEDFLGAALPVDLVEGAELIVAPKSDATISEIIDSKRYVFTRTVGRGRDRTRKEIYDIIKKNEEWLKANDNQTDADHNRGKYFNTIADTVAKLKMEEGDNIHRAVKRSVWTSYMGSIVDRLRQTGVDAGRAASTMVLRYVGSVQRFEKEAEIRGHEWEAARGRAWKASGIASSKRFDEHVYNRGLKFIEGNRNLVETHEDPETEVLKRLKKHFANDEVLSIRLDNSWPAIEKMFRETAKINSWLDSDVRKKLGLKVNDDVLGLLRESIGNPMFTVSRTLSPQMRLVYLEMARRGWGGTITEEPDGERDVDVDEKPNVPPKSENAAAFLADPNALKTKMQAMITPDIVRRFVEPMINVNRPLFEAPAFADGVQNMAKQESITAAWRESNGDLVDFAVRLYEIEDGPGRLQARLQAAIDAEKETGTTPESDLADFVGETLDTFYQYFGQLGRIEIQRRQQALTTDGRSPSSMIPHQLIDSRIAEDFPHEWLEYQRYDQSVSRIIVHQMAIHTHMGRDMSSVNRNIRTAVEEMELLAKEFDDLVKIAADQNPDIDFSKPTAIRKHRKILKDLAINRAKAINDPSPDTFLLRAEAGKKGAPDTGRLQASLKGWFEAQGGGLVEMKAAMEVLQTVSGAIIQGPKTTLLNFMSLFDPIMKFGPSSVARRQVARSWKSLMGETFGSLFGTIGVQLHVNTEYNLRRQRVGRIDTSTHIAAKDRIASVMSQEISGNPIQRAITRGARMVREVLFETGIGKKFEDGEQYTQFRPQAAFSTFVQMMNAAIIDGTWASFDDLVQRGVDFVKDSRNIHRLGSGLSLEASDLGYKKGFFSDDKLAFDKLKSTLNDYGMQLEQVVMDAASKTGAPLFSDEQYAMLASMAINEISMESSIANKPAWMMTNAFLRFSSPLLSWSFARTNQIHDAVRNADKTKSLLTDKTMFLHAMKLFSVIMPLGYAWTMLMDEYDEELVGKRSNIRNLSTEEDFQGNVMAFLERTARVGTFGVVGDVMNGAGNFAEGGDLRGISFDNRVLFANSLLNMMHAVTTFARVEDANYATVYRPMIQAMGGTGYLQYAQILNNAIAPDLPFFREEHQVTRRINAQNYLRVIGRELSLDVRGGASVRSFPNDIKPHVADMIIAAYGNDSSAFSTNYRSAVNAAKGEIRKTNPRMGGMELESEARSRVKRMYQSSHPLRQVFKTMPTENDYRNILMRLPDDGRKDVAEAVMLINGFGQRFLDITPNVGSKEKSKSPARPKSDFRLRDVDIFSDSNSLFQ